MSNSTGVAGIVSVSHGSGVGDAFKVIEGWRDITDGNHGGVSDGSKF